MEGACNASKGRASIVFCVIGVKGKNEGEGGGDMTAHVPELRNSILPTRQSIFSLITSLNTFRSTWNGGAPWTAESALASRRRSACSFAQSHSHSAAAATAAAASEGLAWFVVVVVGTMNEDDRGWENEGLGVSTSAEKPSTTADASCNIVGVFNGGDRQRRRKPALAG